ncbi:MAG TPA: PD-(D/E)XK nuclease family protein [Myxococcota bacterium]|nr:PD-(D/E)XK nuclease family protein [Myxococcota bacterium]
MDPLASEQHRAGARSGCGPRAVEAGLIAELDAACAGAEHDPALLARPLRVIVPSRALSEQIGCALAARGRARVGIRIQTLDRLAADVLERAGESVPPSLLFGEALREYARREPVLARHLDRLDDGYAAVVASVDDLLDAGFTDLHLEPLLERIAEVAGGAALARACAVLRVAAEVARELGARTLGHRSADLARASDLLRADPDLLPARALWIHGFADATGVQLDLLETLAQRFASRVWLDSPDAHEGTAFGARLRERLAPVTVLAADPAPVARVSASRHADPECEARAAATWAREQIGLGIAPERVAIVARDLARHRLALRRQLRRLGVPFSGVAERGAITPAGRDLDALCELLERGGALPAERWLDACALGPAASPADLRDALHALGIATLADLAAAPPARWGEGVSLSARVSHTVDEQGAPRASRRWVDGERIAASQGRASAALRHLEAEPARASLAARAARLADLVHTLGWSEATPGRAELLGACEAFERAGDRPVRSEDWTRVLRCAIADAATDPIGGAGGGVQVLSVMEARARSFEALRVIGLERGAFPRRVSEDALLPDALRRALRDVLPDLPIKGEGHEEERFLFAQLVAAAPQVHLSCAQRDAAGRATPPSPLFERAPAVAVEETACALPSPRDALLEAALHGARAEFSAALPAALSAARRAIGLADEPTAPLARARLAVLRELDPRDARRHELGPFLGAVGPPRGPADPRRAAPFVTQLEGTARCPWQTFLSRILGIAPPPDARAVLPAARDKRLLGNVVHRALALAAATGEWPHSFPRELLVESAREVTAEEGIALAGFANALARCAAPYVEVARTLDAAEGAAVVSAETEGSARVRDAAGVEREMRFIADRVDELGGALRRTDWKTGRAKSLSDHQKGLAQGTLIQAHAYAQDGARARYVYLDPEMDGERVIEASAIDPGRAAFDASVATLLAARDAGAFPPRLRRPDRDEEVAACRTCELRPACLRGDSGARMRIAAWAEVARAGSELERSALALWHLPEAGT